MAGIDGVHPQRSFTSPDRSPSASLTPQTLAPINPRTLPTNGLALLTRAMLHPPIPPNPHSARRTGCPTPAPSFPGGFRTPATVRVRDDRFVSPASETHHISRTRRIRIIRKYVLSEIRYTVSPRQERERNPHRPNFRLRAGVDPARRSRRPSLVMCGRTSTSSMYVCGHD
jgi:hypothetical protein